MPKPVRRMNGTPLSSPLASRLRRWEELKAKLLPFDMEAHREQSGASNGKAPKGGGDIACEDCETYQDLREAWKVALVWTEGLDHGLTTMLASIASTQSVGDQLWLKVIGPASCGKSVLCEALSVNKKHVAAKSTIRGFHSGFKTEGKGSDEDNSLLSTLYGKTLITKDGDTLLQSPNLQQILAEARDIYDGTSRTHYRNTMSKDYEGVRMTWLLCGTSSLRAIDNSELGERFLDCVIMETIDDELEDEILLKVVDRADQNLNLMTTNDPRKRNNPDMTWAMQLTGGYVNWLRENANELLPTILLDQSAKLKCAKLGKFIAFMRARPSIHQEENAEREFGARLASQLTRLSKCLALVLNQDSVNPMILKRATRVAMDTSRGQSLEIARYLHDHEDGSTKKAIALNTGEEEYRANRMLQFMRNIGILETFRLEKMKGVSGQLRWRLTKKFRRLYNTVRGKD